LVTYAPGAVTRIDGHPALRFLAAFPIAGFSGALLTDIVYALTADMIWADFSDWLLAVGAIMGFIAAIAGLVVLLRNPLVHRQGAAWLTALGSVVTLALGILNNLVHSRDAWTSVMPQGLVLSAVTVVVMLLTLWIGVSRVFPVVIAEPALGVLP
jgi:uncharacterized membrane protein